MRWALTLLLLITLAGVTHAERKRVAILAFDGPNAAKLRAEVARLVQKTHTVIPEQTWTKAARKLSATKTTPASVKKVARKLDIDAVIEAAVTERRGGFRVRIRLRDGMTGLSVEALDLKTTGTRLDKASVRDIKNELIDVISSLDDDVRPPTKKKPKK